MEMETTEGVSLEEFLSLVTDGVGVCEESCESREQCGQIACYCIRSVFPHPDYFLLYEKLRRIRFTQEFAKYIEENRLKNGEE